MSFGTQNLSAIVIFIELFEAKDFQFGVRSEPTERNGYYTPSYTMIGKTAQSFVKALYDNGVILTNFDWGTYAQTAEAARLRDDPQVLDQADAGQLSKLLTLIVRSDRFSDGTLADAFTSGLILRILRRAAQLNVESATGEQ